MKQCKDIEGMITRIVALEEQIDSLTKQLVAIDGEVSLLTDAVFEPRGEDGFDS